MLSRGFGKSRSMMAPNFETDESFLTKSVNEMAEILFELDDIDALRKVCDHAMNGRPTEDGFVLEFTSEQSGRVENEHSFKKRPILRLNKDTAFVLEYYASIASAARFIRGNGITNTSLVKISCHILRCIKGHQGCKSAYGFKWRYVTYDEPGENVPLPRPDVGGL